MEKGNNNLLLGAGILTAAFLLFGTKSASAQNPTHDNFVPPVTTPVHYSLDADQVAHIMKLHPVARERFYNFIRYLQEELGWKAYITSSYRTFQQQIKEYAENKHNAIPGHSFHNYGMALDLNLFKGKQAIKKASSAKAWKDSGAVDAANKFGLTWGGEAFATYYDPVHFDMKKFYTSDFLQKKALEQFGSLEKAKGNEIKL